MCTVAVAGATTSEMGAAALTTRKAVPAIEPELAEMIVLPGERLVAYPGEFMAATAGTDDVQVADCVMSWVELSLYVAVAANCSP